MSENQSSGAGGRHQQQWLGSGIAIGVAIGVALSIALDNWGMIGVGIAIGLALGVGGGAVRSRRTGTGPDEAASDPP